MARGGPEFQFRLARRPQLQQVVVSAVVKLDAVDDLRVAAIQALGEPEDGRERADRAPRPALEIAEAVVTALGRYLPMIARHERNCLDLVRLESTQIAVFDEVIRVLVVAFVADVDADVVQERRVFEPFALVVGQSVNGARVVEERERQPRDLLRVLRPVLAPLGQFDHAAAAHVGIAIGLRDFLAVPGDVIEDEALPEGEIAKRDLVGSEPAQDLVEEDRSGHREIRAPWLEAGHAQPLP